MQPLSGIKILDFTRLLPGPVATHLLGQMGAEIIKIENPNRPDYARTTGVQIEEASILYHQINHNKTILSIDYTTDAGREAVIALLQEADVIVEQFRPDMMATWGLGYADIKRVKPTIIYASLTGYGQEGDYRQVAGHDLNYLAYSGVLDLIRDEAGRPVLPAVQLADISGAYTCAMAIQAAIIQRFRTGKGCYVDIALADAILPFLAVPYSLYAGNLPYQAVNILNGNTVVNYAIYACADEKWLAVAALEPKFWNNLCVVVGKLEWQRQHEWELLNAVFPKAEVESLFKTKTRDEWTAIFAGQEVCVAPVLTLDEVESHPYHVQRENFELFHTTGGTPLQTIALPFKIRS